MVPLESAGGNSPLWSQVPFWGFAVGACNDVAGKVVAGELAQWVAIFHIARNVSAHPTAAEYKPMHIAERLFQEADGIGDLDVSEEDFVQQFQSCWKNVIIRPGTDLLGTAAQLADECPLLLLPEHEDDVTRGYKRFVAFCGQLCLLLGTNQLKIPCREVGEALGVNKETVSCYRSQALEQGYLVKLKDHKYRPGGKGEATLFRFRTELWKVISDRLTTAA